MEKKRCAEVDQEGTPKAWGQWRNILSPSERSKPSLTVDLGVQLTADQQDKGGEIDPKLKDNENAQDAETLVVKVGLLPAREIAPETVAI